MSLDRKQSQVLREAHREYLELLASIDVIVKQFIIDVRYERDPLWDLIKEKGRKQISIEYCNKIFVLDFSVTSDTSIGLYIVGKMYYKNQPHALVVDTEKYFEASLVDRIYFKNKKVIMMNGKEMIDSEDSCTDAIHSTILKALTFYSV